MQKIRNFLKFNPKTSKKMSSWPTEQPKWTSETLKLLLDGNTTTPAKSTTNLNEIVSKSKEFPIKFPCLSMISQNLLPIVGETILQRNIYSVYPIIHEYVLFLCAMFLLHKKQFGSSVEKDYYKDKTVKDLINRLINKRAVAFLTSADQYMLINGFNSYGNWESIGTTKETFPLVLENCISYDEIKLSALLSISSYSYFINDGNRYNNGIIEENRSKIQNDGIIIGLIGTRFEKSNVMEYQEIIISPQQNSPENGYGNKTNVPSIPKLFADFYDSISFDYNDKTLQDDSRFIKLEDGLIFDKIAYVKRLALSFDTLFIEANYRAKKSGKFAYIHFVGLGLGVWKLSNHQTQLYVDTMIQRLNFLGNKLSNISDLHFAYISGINNCLGYKHGDIIPIENHPKTGIKILISKREPFTKLNDENKLLIVSYAWDGNALPGNEFWFGSLAGSGDPAAACSTQIAELHNPHINKDVNADHLMIATLNGTVLPLHQYIQQINLN